MPVLTLLHESRQIADTLWFCCGDPADKDKDGKRVYVQNRMAEHASLIWKLVHENKAHIYGQSASCWCLPCLPACQPWPFGMLVALSHH